MEIKKGYKNTEVGVIPRDWEVKELGGIVNKFVNGGTPSTVKQEFWKGNIPWITGADILNQSVAVVRRYITIEAVKNSSTNVIEKGNILFVSRTGVGKLAIAPFDIAISQDFTGIFINKELANPLFLFRYFDYAQNSLKALNQGTSIQGITRDTLEGTLIPLPPTLAEQTAIATALNDTDALIQKLEQLLAKKRAIKTGAMQELLRPKKGWVVKKLGECLLRNPDYGINSAAVSYNDSLPVYLRITDINDDGEYSKKNIVSVNNVSSSNYYLEKNDLVFARTGASVGKTYLYNPKDGELVFAGFLIRIKVNPKALNPTYFKFFTHTENYWNWIRSNSMRTGQPGINGNEYQELEVSIPIIETQTHIAQILSDMDTEIQALEKKIEKYKMIKQGMMQVLLTGKIRLV